MRSAEKLTSGFVIRKVFTNPREERYRWQESLVTKNAPFATDDTPPSQLKLIGSRLIESGIEPRETSAGDQLSPPSNSHHSNAGANQQVEVSPPSLSPVIRINPSVPPLPPSLENANDAVVNVGAGLEHSKRKPLTFSSLEEEEKLRCQIRVELHALDDAVPRLKELYVRLVDFDPRLTGNVSFDVIERIFRQCDVSLSALTLRELSNAFDVSKGGRTAVAYESLLSFIASSLQTTRYHSNERGITNSDTVMRVSDGKTSNVTSYFDFAETWKTFSSVDISRSNSFSFDQMRSLAESCKIPLSETAIEQIINLCGKGKGLYRWQQFLELVREFLSRTSALFLSDERASSNLNERVTWTRQYTDTYSETTDKWSKSFRDLENALFRCDVTGSGRVTKLDAKRLAEDYNDAFGLGFTDYLIGRAVVQCTEESGEVRIVPFLHSLLDASSRR